jgi:hypothetical protein
VRAVVVTRTLTLDVENDDTHTHTGVKNWKRACRQGPALVFQSGLGRPMMSKSHPFGAEVPHLSHASVILMLSHLGVRVRDFERIDWHDWAPE